MLWFRRIKALEAELRRVADERAVLEDRLRAATAKAEAADRRASEAEVESRDILKRFVDFMTYNTVRRSVFGNDVPQAQMGPEPQAVPRRGTHGRDFVRQKTAELFAQEEESMSDFYGTN
jgi:hypothetical protein